MNKADEMFKELEEAKKWIKERILYIAENCDLNDSDNKKAYNSLKTALNYIENSISKEKIEETVKKARLKMFSTRVMNEQEMYFLDKCIHVINDIENELLEGK